MFPHCQVIRDFEHAVANYAGAPFGVSTDTCGMALFLCCKYLNVSTVFLPKKNCLVVPTMVKQAGGNIEFVDRPWKGIYRLEPYPIVDSACRFTSGMYIPETLYCLSFQYQKQLDIGRGGMVLTDDPVAADWLRKARFFGRQERPGSEPEFLGWHAYMEPERAARGLSLLHNVERHYPDREFDYPDCSKMKVFQ